MVAHRVVALLTVVCVVIIQFVHSNYNLLDSQSSSKLSVLLGSATAGLGIKPFFKTSLVGFHNQNRTVRLRSSLDHIMNEVLVPRSINDGELLVFQLEILLCGVNRDSSLPLLLIFVHDGSL